MDIKRLPHKVSRMVKRRQALRSGAHALAVLLRVGRTHARPVTQPLALISQIQRSGGSLLSQLFDGHPQVHAHPHEIKIGYPKKNNWPPIKLDERPERWFELLFEETSIRLFEEGYRKERSSKAAFPFIFLPLLQRHIFLDYLAAVPSPRMRDVLDAYMTSYFGAWLNNQNYVGEKRIVTGFTPRLADDPQNVERFFESYPDGRLISVLRDPRNWYPSAFRHNAKIKKDKYGELRTALEQWNTCARAMVRNKARFGDRVRVLRFEDLVQRTEPVMRGLAGFLGIDFDAILLRPTFNRCPIQANTSFGEGATGIVAQTVERHRTLTADEEAVIEEMTAAVYRDAIACCE